jgi:RNA polymerase sigma-70 factor (ECF subfamily)
MGNLMEDSAIIELYFARNEDAVVQTKINTEGY